MRDMLSAGVAIYDEFPEMYRAAAHRIFRYLAPARNWWYPGGAFHQGTAYSETRFSSDLYPLWIFDRMGAGVPYLTAMVTLLLGTWFCSRYSSTASPEAAAAGMRRLTW